MTHRASKRPKAGKNTPQKKHPAKRQKQSPQRDRPTPQQKPRRRIPQSNHPNLKAKLSASTRSTTSSFPATWIPARSGRASAGGSRTTDVPTWALKKIKLEKDEHDRIVALAQQEMARLTDQIAKADRRYEQNTSFLTSMLAEFFETVPHKKTKTGTESYRLLHGQLVKKPAGIKLQPDDEKLVAWLRAAGREDLIKVEEKAMWGELKKKLEMVGTVAMMPDTGEIIEGIDVVEVPAAFSVKF